MAAWDKAVGASTAQREWEYDDVFNVSITKLDGQVDGTRTFNTRNQVTADSSAATQFAYLPTGEEEAVTGPDTRAIEWDSAGRPIHGSVTTASGTETVDWSYDPIGRLRSRTDSSGGSTAYCYFGGSLLRRVSGSQVAEDCVPDPFSPGFLWSSADGGTYFCNDLWGNLMFTRSSPQDSTRSYSPWGAVSETDAPGTGLRDAPGGFVGGEHEEALGLVRLGARLYDPALSRFISEDPIGQAGGVNVYAYGLGDPFRFSDPSGLSPTGMTNSEAGLGLFANRVASLFEYGSWGKDGTMAQFLDGVQTLIHEKMDKDDLGGYLKAKDLSPAELTEYFQDIKADNIADIAKYRMEGDADKVSALGLSNEFLSGLITDGLNYQKLQGIATAGLEISLVMIDIPGAVAGFAIDNLDLPPAVEDGINVIKTVAQVATGVALVAGVVKGAKALAERFGKNAAKGGGRLFHYTDGATAELIERSQLGLPDRTTFLTPNGNLSPTQAGIELALPRGNTAKAVFDVSVDALDPSRIGGAGRVTGNVFGRGGGGVEVLYEGTIPRGAFRRIR